MFYSYRLMLREFFSRKFDFYREKSRDTANLTIDTILKVAILILFVLTIIWLSVFLYVAFYYSYVPSTEHVRTVSLQFKACEGGKIESNVCSFPTAHVQLTKANELLMLGQPYKMKVLLEVPESEANKALGMFMVCGQLLDKVGVTVAMSCRSAMLRYRSPLVHTLTTLALAPLYVFEYLEEKQMIEVELFADFQDDQSFPVTDMVIELKSRKVEVYSSKLEISARLSGMRYLMFHFPAVSAAFGITFNLAVILLIAAMSWWHLYGSEQQTGRELLYKKIKEKFTPVFKLKKEPVESTEEEEEEEKEDKGVVTLGNGSSESELEGKSFIELGRHPSSSEA